MPSQLLTRICPACREEKPTTQFSPTTKPGPGGRRYTTFNSRCKPCRNTYNRDWYEANREQRRRYHKDWITREPRRRMEGKLRERYGLTLKQYDAMVTRQGGLCAICRKPNGKKFPDGTPQFLVVDHDHTTGVVRGLLCDLCNHGVGCFRDSPDILNAAIAYLSVQR